MSFCMNRCFTQIIVLEVFSFIIFVVGRESIHHISFIMFIVLQLQYLIIPQEPIQVSGGDAVSYQYDYEKQYNEGE